MKRKIVIKEEICFVGAVLVINGNLEGIAGNSAKTNGNWASHAENPLLHKVSWKIKEKKGNSI